VSKTGFIMENEKLQLFIGLFWELKKDLNDLKTNINDVKTDVKMDIRAVTIGQDDLKTELKNDIENSISDMRDNISALETIINAGQEELRREISVFQERIRNIETGQAAFEERVKCTVDTHLRDMSSVVEQQTRNLREDLSRNIEAGQADFEERVTRNLREDLRRNIETGQVELEERLTCAVYAWLKNASSVVEAIRQDFETKLAALKFEAAKAAAWPTARQREVTRVPTGRTPTLPERRRNERPLCWQCGNSGHFWMDCRQRPPGETGQDSRKRRSVS
jgi:hypothetical protein